MMSCDVRPLQLYLDPAGESATHKAAWMVDDPFWGNPYWNG